MPPIKLGASKWRLDGEVGLVVLEGSVLEGTAEVTSGVLSVGN